jgi:2-C-methyl-D-erythritol 4-phosphate cytidylyltransferase
MQADRPKQYLTINDKTILEHTVCRMAAIAQVKQVIVSVNPQDQYIHQLGLHRLFEQQSIRQVFGGAERVDSVLAGLKAIDGDEQSWVMVHDAARPNVSSADVEHLIDTCLSRQCGGILATPVRDTMKRGDETITHTECRENLWHALTPQFFPLLPLIKALEQGLSQQLSLTDEASAMEKAGFEVLLVEGRSDNIKVTKPEDLALATFYLNQ